MCAQKFNSLHIRNAEGDIARTDAKRRFCNNTYQSQVGERWQLRRPNKTPYLNTNSAIFPQKMSLNPGTKVTRRS